MASCAASLLGRADMPYETIIVSALSILNVSAMNMSCMLSVILVQSLVTSASWTAWSSVDGVPLSRCVRPVMNVFDPLPNVWSGSTPDGRSPLPSRSAVAPATCGMVIFSRICPMASSVSMITGTLNCSERSNARMVSSSASCTLEGLSAMIS